MVDLFKKWKRNQLFTLFNASSSLLKLTQKGCWILRLFQLIIVLKQITNCQCIGHLNVTKEILCKMIFIEWTRYCPIFQDEIMYIKNEYLEAGYPYEFIQHVLSEFLKTEKVISDWLFKIQNKVFFKNCLFVVWIN